MAGRAANGMGTITKRKDGRYQAAVYVLNTAGHRERKYVYGKTWDEANDKRVELLDNNRKGIPSISSNMALGDYLDYWVENIIKEDRAYSTYAGYETVIRRFIKPLLGHKKLNRLSPRDIRAFVAALRTRRTVHGAKLSDRYVQNVFEVLRSALTAAVKQDELIGRNVAMLVTTPSRGEHDVAPLDEDSARKFLRAIADHWLCALWLLLITTGLRKGEVLGLAWSDIDLDTGEIKVRRTVQRIRGQLRFGKPKTPRSRRTVYVGDVVKAALKRHRTLTAERMKGQPRPASDQPGDLVFVTSSGQVVEPRNVNTMLRRILKKAGLGHSRVHDLRHTAATLLLLDGATIREVMEQLGHSSIATTANIYGHVLDVAKRRMAERMDRRFSAD
ncbi:tyrosine-type recombinase/integrase [Amycolatopsis magusensis]|uniref:tyrosine-type recombinase/integrase n=1 Tax=Amycolatopsis magusensis TaxID=882444 RepID=UPI0024A8D971|nr:tyrosine-type recombinase/integrase [Amycolatopsis magusensis]MDI5974781.1 tyrosine-type recombinase/integrase [Amycolatopsis magusensis]